MKTTYQGLLRSSSLSAVLLLGLVLEPGDPACGQDLPEQPEVISEGVAEGISIGMGHSVVIHSPWPTSRVSITDPAVADVQVLTPLEIMLTGHALGSTDLFLWGDGDLIWHAKVHVVVDLTYVETELNRIFPDAELSVMQSQDMLVINGQLRRIEECEQLHQVLDAYGIKYVDMTSVAGVHQVMLQVRIAEMNREMIRALGTNFAWGGNDFFGAQRIGSADGGPLNPGADISGAGELGDFAISSGVTLLAGFPSADLIFFLQALAENQYARILAEPTLVAMSGETASFLAGGEYPIPVVQGGDSGGGSSISVEYKEFGVRLEFTPLVLGNGQIRLHVAPEVSELSEFGAVNIEGFEIPSLLARRAETTLELKSGQTFTIAGLLNQSSAARNSRIPLLGDIPVLGALFRSVRYVHRETELVVLVTASLVEPSSETGTLPVPGDLHVMPNDWELFVNGQLEGERPVLAPAHAALFKQMELDRLRGPGAWVTYEQSPAPFLPSPEPAGGSTDTAAPETPADDPVSAESSAPERQQ